MTAARPPADTQLSPHFHASEFTCRDGTPAPRITYGSLRNLCHRYLEPLRARYGPVRVISGYRTPAWNRKVGGVAGSKHLYRGTPAIVAADVACARGSAHAWYELLDELGPGGLGRYPDHVHVDTRHVRARW